MVAFYTFNILCFVQGTAEQKTQFSDLIVSMPGSYKGQAKDGEILDKLEWLHWVPLIHGLAWN